MTLQCVDLSGQVFNIISVACIAFGGLLSFSFKAGNSFCTGFAFAVEFINLSGKLTVPGLEFIDGGIELAVGVNLSVNC